MRPRSLPLGVLCPRAKRKVDEDDSLSHWQYMAFWFIDFEEHEVCNLHCRLETLWLKVFLLPPATRMLLASRRNPAMGGN